MIVLQLTIVSHGGGGEAHWTTVVMDESLLVWFFFYYYLLLLLLLMMMMMTTTWAYLESKLTEEQSHYLSLLSSMHNIVVVEVALANSW
jgi:uncharacterized membrane protein